MATAGRRGAAAAGRGICGLLRAAWEAVGRGICDGPALGLMETIPDLWKEVKEQAQGWCAIRKWLAPHVKTHH